MTVCTDYRPSMFHLTPTDPRVPDSQTREMVVRLQKLYNGGVRLQKLYNSWKTRSGFKIKDLYVSPKYQVGTP